MWKVLVLLCATLAVVRTDVAHLRLDETTTRSPPPAPYAFSYGAGRYPGHVDRTHTEVSDGSGTVRGAYQYVDPNNEVRTVEYIADEYGFYPSLSHIDQPPKQSEAVQRATNKHIALFNRIAEENSHPQEDLNLVSDPPKDTEAVEKAKNKHLALFEKIAQEHARLAAELEAERQAFEATSEASADCAVAGACNGDVAHLRVSTTQGPPPGPYAFSYGAGRRPGHVDRTHTEVSDGTGTVRGAFQYVDPNNEIRTVEYIADEYGFYPSLSHIDAPVRQTAAVEKATQQHITLFNKIAEQNSRPQEPHQLAVVDPKDTKAVAAAKDKHFTLYDKIVQDHARIAAEREAERLAFEATSVATPEDEANHYKQY